MKAIIFGINGQDGVYLRELLKQHSVEVIGVSRSINSNWIQGNVKDFSFVSELIKTHQPDFIFHFAATSTTQHYALFDNYDAITTGTLNILEAVKNQCPKSRIFISGSAMQFKNTGLPIDENTPFEPGSAYAVARIQSVYAARYYRNIFGLQVYIGYLFNHDSPLRSEKHINQKIVKTVQRISQGSNEILELGNVEVMKEFNYAQDIVNAIWQLVNHDSVFEAVIGSGKTYKLKDWVEYCFGTINKNWKDYVQQKPDFVSEYQILVSNPGLIMSLGWQPTTNFYQLADLMLEC